MGMSGRVLTDWVGEGELVTYGARFTGQVWPGDSLTATATVIGAHHDDDLGWLTDFELLTLNQHGSEVLRGIASARRSQ